MAGTASRSGGWDEWVDGAAGLALGETLGAPVRSAAPVGGGCISDARRVELSDGRVLFVKSGAGLPAGLLEVEADGLRWLAEPGAVRIPRVVALVTPDRPGRAGASAPERELDGDLLVLEWVEPTLPAPDTPERLGAGLAQLHAAGAPGFGWHRDGFIGRLPQRNTPRGPDWPGFWFTCRVEPLVRQALDRRALPPGAAELVSRLGDRLVDLAGPPEAPARLHGDLWAGNLMTGPRGEPWLVDPAPYGGHREVDLAMLELFGRPDPATLAAYQEVAPLAEGWRERLPLWQLEPLLTHTVMFGGSYAGRAHAVLRRYA